MKLNKNFNKNILIKTILSHRALSRCIIFIFVLVSSLSFSQNLTSSIDSTQIKIGSQFNLTIKANVKPTDRVSFPEGQTFGALEVLESNPVDTVNLEGKYELIKKYGLTQFDSGRYVIPPLSVIINEKTVKTDSFVIVVNNVVVDTTKQKMYDIKPIIAVDKPFSWFWLWVILIVLGAAAIGYGIYYFLKRKQTKQNEKEAVLFASPIEKALTHLQQLEQKGLWQKGETKAYYSELTEITRTYIEEEVDVPAMESTSTELFDALVVAIKKQKIKLNRQTLDEFKKVMSNADLVKFAKSKPLDFEIENDKKTLDNFLMALDKAIPRTEDETVNMFAEELKRKKERKQKLQRILIPVSAVVMLLGIAGTFFLVTKGTDYIRDKFIGHSTSSLLEAEWITSDYGDPAIIVSTPKVLKRMTIASAIPPNVKSASNFVYGSLTDSFSIILKTVAYKDTTRVDLEMALESNLQQLNLLGAKNIIIDTGDIDLEGGITGKVARGTFTAKNPITSQDEKLQYQIICLSQTGGSQDLWLVNKEDDEAAIEIAKRVVESIKLKTLTPNDE